MKKISNNERLNSIWRKYSKIKRSSDEGPLDFLSVSKVFSSRGLLNQKKSKSGKHRRAVQALLSEIWVLNREVWYKLNKRI